MAPEPCSTATTRDLELLEKHLLVLIKAARDEQDLYNKLTQSSLDKYEGQVETKFHEVNNLREGLTKDYVRREAYEALGERLSRVAEATEGRLGVLERGAAMAHGLGATVESNKGRISEVEKTLANMAGRQTSISVMATIIATMVSLVIAALGVFVGHR